MKKIIVLSIIYTISCVSIFGQIKKSAILTEQPTQYQRIDVDIELVAKWKNPFLQEDVALNMLMKSPSGKELFLPCFYESGESGKNSEWKARFAPQESGAYEYTFQLIKSGKVISSTKPASFQAKASDKPGFLHTKSDWVLQFDNGKPFRGVAENICWESRDQDDSKFFKALHERADIYNYESLLAEFSACGGNFFRTWICNWNLPFDYKGNFNNSRYTPSSEFYNPSAALRLDQMLNIAESSGLYIMLTLGMGGYLVEDGGLVNSSDEFFAEKTARDRYKNRLRYIVARWGYSTSIAMWEFFNEVDNVQYNGREVPVKTADIVDWHKEMSAYIKKIDPYNHIVTTSISHRDVEGLNSLPDIDINQKHIYNDTDIIPSEIWKYTKEFKKPYIIGEFGYDWDWSKDFNGYANDMDIDFKRGIWYGVFSPTPVFPMTWWWEFFENRSMTSYYRGVKEINDKMLLAGNGSFEPLKVTAGNSHVFALKCGSQIFVYLYNPAKSVFMADLEIEMDGNKKYKVRSYEPSSMIYKDYIGIETSSSKLILKNVALGAQKEMLYLIEPLN